jgi:integrase
LSLATNVVRRGSRYYIRLRVPSDLVSNLGRAELWRSLGTSDPREARRRSPNALSAVYEEWEQARQAAAAAPAGRDLTEDELRKYAGEFYEWELERDSLDRRSNARSFLLIDPRTLDLNRQDAIKMINTGESYYQVDHFIQLIAKRDGLAHREEHPTYRQLGQTLLRVLLETQNRARERDEGRFDGQPVDPILLPKPPSAACQADLQNVIPLRPSPAPLRGSGPVLGKLLEPYLADKKGLSAEWQGTQRAILDLFLDFIGPATPASQIGKAHVRDWKQALHKFPSRGTLRNPNARFNEIVRKNETEQKPAILTRTINKYLSAVSSWFDWLVRHEYAEKNPAEGLQIEDSAGGSRRDPFSEQHLQKIFGSPLFVGCKSGSSSEAHLAGAVHIRNWCYWLPLLSLFTGARLGELAQLYVADVQLLDGINFLNINDQDEKGLKTSNSRRVIPLHDELTKLGFLDSVSARRKGGERRLFADIEPDKLGRLSTNPSKFLNKYLKRIGVKVNSRLSVHSFRHNFIDALRMAGHNDGLIQAIVGHGQIGPRVTAGYGTQPSFPLAQRAAIINSVSYAFLDLSRLYPS